MSDNDTKRQLDLEWENRVLCSDESCIGTIAPDGRCRECGKPFEGTLPQTFGRSTDTIDDTAPPLEDAAPETGPDSDDGQQPPSSGESDDPAAVTVDADGEATDGADDDDWARRTLCSDESCIGTIGPDGLCRECGKPYDG